MRRKLLPTTFGVLTPFGVLIALSARSTVQTNPSNLSTKTIVFYAWFEAAHEVPNLLYFIKHAVMKERSDLIDFLFIDTTPGGSKYIPTGQPNVRLIQRANVGADMGSWKVGLGTIHKADYANFVFMNGCVAGPFLGQFPSAANFVSPFASLLHGNVHLAGTSVNCLCGNECEKDVTHLHLQSMFLVTDHIGVTNINSTLQSASFNDKNDAFAGELAISMNMLKAGYGIAATQKYWRGHDFQDSEETKKRCAQFVCLASDHWGDPYHTNGDVDPVTFSQKDIDPEEVVMFKANRHVAEDRLKALESQGAMPISGAQKSDAASPVSQKKLDLCLGAQKSEPASGWLLAAGFSALMVCAVVCCALKGKKSTEARGMESMTEMQTQLKVVN